MVISIHLNYVKVAIRSWNSISLNAPGAWSINGRNFEGEQWTCHRWTWNLATDVCVRGIVQHIHCRKAIESCKTWVAEWQIGPNIFLPVHIQYCLLLSKGLRKLPTSPHGANFNIWHPTVRESKVYPMFMSEANWVPQTFDKSMDNIKHCDEALSSTCGRCQWQEISTLFQVILGQGSAQHSFREQSGTARVTALLAVLIHCLQPLGQVPS